MEKSGDMSQSLETFIKSGTQLKQTIDSEYITRRREKTLSDEIFTSWIADIDSWGKKVVNELFLSDSEIYLFNNAGSNGGYPDKVNMRYWDIVSKLDAQIKRLASFKIQNAKSIHMEFVGGDKIQQSGDRNSITKNQTTSVPWYQRPIGMLVIGVVTIILGTFITMKFGWI